MRMSSIKDLLPIRVKVFDPEEVTTRSGREVDPRAAGLRQKDIDAIWRSVEILYKTGLHPAIALCIRRRGEVILDRAIGHARGNSPKDPEGTPLVRATPDTLYNFFSGSKCILAMLIHLLHEREQLHVDEPVATFIPEFGKKRKHRITIKDILTHRAGIPAVPTEALDIELIDNKDRICELFCGLEPIMRAGEETAYHALTGGFVLREVLERVTGMDVRDFLTKEVREPLGFKYFNWGVQPHQLDLVAEEAFTGPIPTWPHKDILQRMLGLSMREVVDVANEPRLRTGVLPAGNVIGTPDEFCQWFELLLDGGKLGGTRIFQQRTVNQATEEQARGQIDRIIMLPVPYSMGFMLGSDVFGFFGVRSGKAFGHLGFTNVLGWADPERDISVAFMNTGKPLIAPRMVAWLNVMRTISTRIPRDRPIP